MIRTTTAVLVLLAGPLAAQTHDRDPLVRGQPATFSFTGMPPTSFGAVLISPQAGQGPCAPAPLSFCLGLLDPIFVGPQLPSDASGHADFTIRVAPDSTLFSIATQGLWFDLRTPLPTFVTTNAVDGAVTTLAYYNEAFDGDRIRPDWSFRNRAMFTGELDGSGRLRLTPLVAGTNGSWSGDHEGPMLYREIWGDFSLSTRLSAFDSANETRPPQPSRRLGGLLVRNPASSPGARDWIAAGIGSGTSALPHALTAIDTQASASAFIDVDQSTEPNPLEVELRIVRQGNTIHCEYRNIPTLPFATLHTATRPNLPLALEVGLFVSSTDAPPSVVAAFTEVRYEN